MIDGKNFFDQSLNNDLKILEKLLLLKKVIAQMVFC